MNDEKVELMTIDRKTDLIKTQDAAERLNAPKALNVPKRQGLYDPRNEHDACGIGFVANIKNVKSHDIVRDGLTILDNLEHRGAVGADPKAGDGVGILIQTPHAFLTKMAKQEGFDLPSEGQYGVGMIFFPKDADLRAGLEVLINEQVAASGLTVLGWRDVPVDSSELGYSVVPSEPFIRQIFVTDPNGISDQDAFERTLFVIRRHIELKAKAFGEAADHFFYIPSFSSYTLLYKGLLLSSQLGNYYLDLKDPDMSSAIALVHQRFSTNTFPTWKLAHPFRMICHNGEINTVRGNVNWMAARHASLSSDILGDELEGLWPLIEDGQSDSASFDNALELLVQAGYSLPHAMMMMIPEAWGDHKTMDQGRRAFYEYHAALMEPWDGPAAVAFTNGRQIGATLDRNGLRPARYYVTKDDRVVMASEMGVLPVDESQVIKKWRLQPGKMLLIDLEQGRIIDDEELKADLSQSHPYQDWLNRSQIRLSDLPSPSGELHVSNQADLLDLQQAYGYTQEDLKFLLSPMLERGEEAIGSMGTDTPISALSDRAKPLYTYFKQNFAQVTNPPIDPIREELVMSLISFIGPRPNLLNLEGTSAQKRLEVANPILSNDDLEKIRLISDIEDNAFHALTIDMSWPASEGAEGMTKRIAEICDQAEKAILGGKENILILSDRAVNAQRVGIPALLAVAAVHHHLINAGLRTSTGLVVESGEPREIHHLCCLAGYGAEAINPYLAFDTIDEMRQKMDLDITREQAVQNFIKASGKGIMKVMSKMGISTYQSYCGAQIFDSVGLAQTFIDRFFVGTATTIEGIGVEEVAEETVRRHSDAFGDKVILENSLEVGGEYAVRTRGEDHVWNAETITNLQHAVRGNDRDQYKAYAKLVNEQDAHLLTLRGLFKMKKADELGLSPVALDEVEPVTEIVKRFATGAMSFGSISPEAHTNLAVAMNRIGGKSNTGEGGEESQRYTPMDNGDSMRSAIKQVASGRFGVTTEYLVNSDMIQIKMAQGAKPGEGGQLPGHKVDQRIAAVRHSTPGVGLISPPPHHDIYSIEDLAQLIFDLKNTNPTADVSVKLVSEVGVGTVAAGVSKARADHVTISGFEGGTGASPLTSIKHAGSPWEIGLAETHQTLVLNNLRTRIAVQVDGGLRTGRDVVIGALLGADEFGFATAPLIASGCIMMRKCHLNTCPVGIATQNEELRKRFTGTPEHVINYFFFVAEEVREILAEMGVRSLNELIGQTDRLDMRDALDHWKAQGLDFTRLFTKMDSAGEDVYHTQSQEHPIHDILDRKLIEQAKESLETGKPAQIKTEITNIDRTAGAMLSGELAKRYGHAGLPEDTISIHATGTAGQSFGAFLTRGISFELEGQGNDYVGKGLSGGRIAIYPPANSGIVPGESIIAGNTLLYGAVSGEAYLRGVVGERFAVRNSGALTVIEGAGDHCCEYMTGGCVVVLGETGRNFAAGMSGGIAYVLDQTGDFEQRCNMSMVELEEITGEVGSELSYLGADMANHDAERLYRLIENHARYTNSSIAKEILDNFETYRSKFVKVMPTEYRRALRELDERNAEAQHVAGE
jgi:glutamate synthase (NADPH/NADH) large chain